MQFRISSNAIIGNQSFIFQFGLAIFAVAALWVSAKINVPFWPVPMTMQTMIVLMIGIAYGRLAFIPVGLYLLAGAMGLPVFAGSPEKGIGIPYIVGPTGGYLLGFFVCSVLVGWLGEKGWDKNFSTTLVAMFLGNLVIYALGVLWLSRFVGFEKSLQFGVYPFLLGDALKILLATTTIPLISTLIRNKN